MISEPVSESASAVYRAQDLDRLRKTAGEVVGSAFFGTLLKMMRNDPFKGKYGHGGRGEEAFAGQLHGVMAERLGAAMRRGPGEAVYRHLASQQERASRARHATWEQTG